MHMNWKCVVRRALFTGETHHTCNSKESRSIGGLKNIFAESFIRLWQRRGLTQSLNVTSIPLVLSALHGKESDGFLMTGRLC